MTGINQPLHTRWQYAAYALPALPLAGLALPLYIIVPTFYADVIGLPLASVGMVLLAIRILDAITDPLFGWSADSFSKRIGRRKGFFLLSIPVTALSGFMLFWPPMDAGLIYLGLWGALASIGYTWTVLPYTAWGAELVTDYTGRARLSAWREAATLVGTLLAISLPFTIGLQRADGFHGLAAMGLLLLVALPLCAMVATVTVPEPKDHSTTSISFLQSLQFLARNGPFVRLISAFFLNGFANAIPATLFLYFVSDRLRVPDMRGPFLFLYFLSAIAGVPLALKAAGRFGKHRAWCGSLVTGCAIFALSGFLGSGDVIPFGAICVLTGLLLGFDLALPPSIQADVIDVDTATSGAQRSGFYFAAWSLATKLALALAVGAVFPILDYAGFKTSGTVNAPSALTVLGILYAWMPIIPKLAAAALMWNFPIGKLELAAVQQRIASTQR